MIALTTLTAYIFGQRSFTLVFVFFATAFGQASIGWVNDYVDVSSDKRNKREHKPLVRDSMDPRDLRLPIFLALALTVPFSFMAAGWFGGLAHILAVASAQLYNLYLSRTFWSWLPYVVSFGLLSVFVFQSVSVSSWPSWQLVVIASCVGVIAHIFNALPDLEMDRASDHGGFVVAIGKVPALTCAVVLALMTLLFIASVLVS